MSTPFELLFGHGRQQERDQLEQRHEKVAQLSQLLDRPDVTIDAKEAIATHLDDLMNVPAKTKGIVPTLVKIFHHQQQTQQPRVIPEHMFGDPNQQILTKEAGPDAPDPVVDPNVPLENRRVPDALAQMGTPPEVRRRGSMTSGEIADIQGMEKYKQQRGVLSEIDRQNDERTRQRQIELQNLRNQGAAQRVADTLHNKQIFLNDQEQARARRDILEVNAAHPDWTPEQSAGFVADKFQQEKDLRDARIAQTKALTLAIPERLRLEGDRVAQGWQRLDLDTVRNQVLSDVAKNKGDLEAFDRETKPLFTELASVRKQIEYFNKFSNDPTMAAKLKEEQDYEANLLNQIWQKKGQYVKPSEPTPIPQRGASKGGGRGAKYVAPKVSADRLKELMAP